PEGGGLYLNAELGGGTYTLLAAPAGQDDGREYGIRDEAAAVNLNHSDQAVLLRLPGLDADLAASIVALRDRMEGIGEIEDLLLIEGIDAVLLYGEDRNGNGVLDPCEDDGEATLPPDNADARLETGLAEFLTCRSAVRNVTADGKERVNINTADAEQLKSALTNVSEEQALSIVEHRKKGEFESIGGLLDVMLVEKEQKRESEDGGQGGRPQQGPGANEPQARPQQPNQQGGGSDGGQSDRTTDEKAFSSEEFVAIADLLTITDDEVLHGPVNVNTAPPEVLACLPGMDQSLALAVVDRRRQAPYESVGELLDLDGLDAESFKKLCNLVAVRSDVFSVRSFGVVGGTEGPAAAQCCVHAVIDRTEDGIRLASWRELH
ncbi:MAG: hypothetical protein GXY85_05865, partial [Candidatus Brocadiaceae bacterium]|nr:hypothetical protein [Candidatus Brocadiaceae bacterium]